MKYKKRSLKNRRQKRQRHRFSKKYYQLGGGFMDAIAQLNAMEGRTNMCMTVHPTQPLVAVGDDAGIITLWEINQSQPKRLAQLTGLPTAVKFVEFHKTFPVVAAACSDRVLMWKFDKISREQQQEQEGAVQQLEPSHTLSVFGLRSQEEVEQELREMEQMKKEAEEKYKNVNDQYLSLRKTLSDITSKIYEIEKAMKPLENKLRGLSVVTNEDEVLKTKRKLQELTQQLKEQEEQHTLIDHERAKINQLVTIAYRDFIEKHKKTNELKSELEMIRIDARDEVSCIAFYPLWSEKNSSYIAVGVNNHNNIDDNRIIMHRFNIEPSSSSVIYTLPPSLVGEPPNETPDDVLTASFSHDGRLFAFVTKSSDGRTVLKVQNFKDGESRYYQSECKSYRIDGEKKRAITSIRPYSSDTWHHYHGTQRKNEFLVGCDDGSLTMIQAITETPRSTVVFGNATTITKVTELTSIPGQERTSREAIECVAVHPSSLPLFASGSRNSVQVWGIDSRDALKSLALQPGLVPVRSIGFNQNFLAVCGPGNVSIYSCNAEDYRGFKEELQKELKIGSEIAEYGTELVLAGRQGEPCSICGDPMNDPLSQQTLRSGPIDAQELYLECGHKFHKDCIEPWIKQRKPCPLCRAQGGIAQATPQRIVKGRDEQELERAKTNIQSIADKLRIRTKRYEPRVLFGQPAAASSASSAVEVVPVAEPVAPVAAELTPNRLRAARLAYFSKQQQQQQPPPQSEGGKNKYSRKKYTSNKSKNRHRYSKKYKY
jgi:WD40 repeat protein